MAPQPTFTASLPLCARAGTGSALCARRGSRLRRGRRTRMCASAAPAPVPTSEEIEKLFSRLGHKNQALRTAAGSSLAEIGGDEIIARLVRLLSEPDTAHRRAAVQALGMAGAPGVAAVTGELGSTTDMTARASCAKALAAATLFHPGMRENFPADAVAALRQAIVGADPVTKIAAVGCLGTMGCDAKGEDGKVYPGNEQAFAILGELLGQGLDVATGAVAVGAVAQIGQNASAEKKAKVIVQLKELAGEEGEDDDESGFTYIKEMARTHIEQLEDGPNVPVESD